MRARCSTGQSLFCSSTPCQGRQRHRFVVRVCGGFRDVCPLVVSCGGASQDFSFHSLSLSFSVFRVQPMTFLSSVSGLQWLVMAFYSCWFHVIKRIADGPNSSNDKIKQQRTRLSRFRAQRGKLSFLLMITFIFAAQQKWILKLFKFR